MASVYFSMCAFVLLSCRKLPSGCVSVLQMRSSILEKRSREVEPFLANPSQNSLLFGIERFSKEEDTSLTLTLCLRCLSVTLQLNRTATGAVLRKPRVSSYLTAALLLGHSSNGGTSWWRRSHILWSMSHYGLAFSVYTTPKGGGPWIGTWAYMFQCRPVAAGSREMKQPVSQWMLCRLCSILLSNKKTCSFKVGAWPLFWGLFKKNE